MLNEAVFDVIIYNNINNLANAQISDNVITIFIIIILCNRYVAVTTVTLYIL